MPCSMYLSIIKYISTQELGLFGTSPGREESQSMIKLEKSLEETRRERDKAKKELNRLKQHLLDKVTAHM